VIPFHPRYLESAVKNDLKEKMVFVGGPRQVGKSSLAVRIAESYSAHESFTWDDAQDRKTVRENRYAPESRCLVFDELHKWSGWQNHLKGLYDKDQNRFHILVTGSARLDVYRRGGDSLLGRYHYHRLHPLSVVEVLTGNAPPPLPIPFEELRFPQLSGAEDAVGALLKFGGFPEPFFRQDEKVLRRWHVARMERLISQDIRDTEFLRDLSKLEQLADLLPGKVGSLFSINSVREDLEVTHKTVSHWVDVLERFYVHFRIRPFHGKAIHSLRKEPKLYLWDWSQASDEGARMENLVASHLLKFVHRLHDSEGHRADLHFLRDRAGRETDFLVTVDRRPWFAVEVKRTADPSLKNLSYFGERLSIPFLYQVVFQPTRDTLKDNTRTLSASRFLSALS